MPLLDIIIALFLIACILAISFAAVNGIIALFRYRLHSKHERSAYEDDLIRKAARRDAYMELARFAENYFDDEYFGNKIRQLWYTIDACPKCAGKGKKWTNSQDSCSSCWGTGKDID
jgi:hypothetical protein